VGFSTATGKLDVWDVQKAINSPYSAVTETSSAFMWSIKVSDWIGKTEDEEDTCRIVAADQYQIVMEVWKLV